jgi:hypothetical protein
LLFLFLFLLFFHPGDFQLQQHIHSL